MTNKEKFLALVAKEETNTLSRAQERIANRGRNRKAFAISLAILERLDQLTWSQKRMAEEMGVSPQQINKWVSGKENFTLDTISKIEEALDFQLIEVVKEKEKPCILIHLHSHTNYQEWSYGNTGLFEKTVTAELIKSYAFQS